MVAFRQKISGMGTTLVSSLISYNNAMLTFFQAKSRSLKATTNAALQLVPGVIKKPSVVGRWFFGSYWFYIAVVVAVVLMNSLVYSAVNRTLNKIYPPQVHKKMFGLATHATQDPRVEWQRNLIMGVFWIGAGGLNIYVLLLCLPRVVRKASAKAREREAAADTMVTIKPSESIMLYSKALKLAVDAEHESALKNKIATLDNAIKNGTMEISPSTPSASPEKQGTGTVVLTANEFNEKPGQEDIIGPDGRYRIERKLGEGAMGMVFLAQDQTLIRKVALKKLTFGHDPNQQMVTRFQQEARALARLSHTNIVQIYDFIQVGKQNWIAMEYVEGEDLDKRISESGKYAFNAALEMCIQISEAMDHAHRRGVVHRDFKPSNVIISADNTPKITDFGIAKLTLSSIATMEGSLLGTPAFMSPEQARGEPADGRSDIYALGVTLYQLLTGDLPFEGDVKGILAQKIGGSQPSLVQLEKKTPPGLVDLVKKMMGSDPEERPSTMGDVNQALKRLL